VLKTRQQENKPCNGTSPLANFSGNPDWFQATKTTIRLNLLLVVPHHNPTWKPAHEKALLLFLVRNQRIQKPFLNVGMKQAKRTPCLTQICPISFDL